MAYALAWLVCLASTVTAGIFTSIVAALTTIYNYRDYSPGYHDENGVWIPSDYVSKWTGTLWDKSGEALYKAMVEWGIAAMASWLAALAALIVLMILTGRFGRDEEGRIHLNWFDRIWTEVHLICGIVAATFFGLLVGVLYELWPVEDWFGLFQSDFMDEEVFGFPNSLCMALVICGMVATAAITWLCLLSVVKKLKAHGFWRKSFVGIIWGKVCGIWQAIWREIKESDRLMVKVVAYLLLICCGAGICGIVLANSFYYGEFDTLLLSLVFFIGTIALILSVVPKQMKKYRSIREGVKQIRQGNLAYKIPIVTGSRGALGELDRLAEDINLISQAQSIAVENELKNQRMKTELISNVSHDLKTPLTSMTAYVDLLKQEGLDSPNAPEYLDIIDNKTQRLKALTENLFDAAKASSGAIPVTISAIDLAALVNQALAEMEGKLSQRSLTVILKNKCEDSSRVMADGQLLWRVIENLLSNVSKYALTGSRVYVNISRLQASDTAAGGSAADGAGAVGFGFAGATVGGFGGGSTDGAGGAAGAGANLGAGGAGSFGAGSACFSEIDGAAATKILLEVKNISAEQLNISAEELMERFKRGDESRNTEGSGLGLAIARDLTNLMKGTFHLTIDGDLFKASVALHEAGGQEGGQGSSGMEVASE